MNYTIGHPELYKKVNITICLDTLLYTIYKITIYRKKRERVQLSIVRRTQNHYK